MPKVTDAHLEARRQQILEAASACFARQGFHHTTVQDICREAVLSPGAVYGYFASKEEIIAASCLACEQYNQAQIQAAGQNDDPLEVLDLLVDSGFGRLENPESMEHMRMNIQLWAEGLRNPQILEVLQRTFLQTWLEALTQLIRLAQENGQLNSSIDAPTAARVLLSTYYGLVLQKTLDPAADISKYAGVLKSMYRGTFAARTA